MTARWSICPVRRELREQWSRVLKISPLLAQCLINRGIVELSQASTFLNPRLQDLRDPFELPGMRQAVNRLWQAREQGEIVLIFGDYDVDGVTSTAIVLETLRGLGIRGRHYLPRRRDDGYGLSSSGLNACLHTRPTQLLLAVDCGSNADVAIRQLQNQGVDVIVVDHHQVSDPAPPALAIVNPRVRDNPTGSGLELCSAGLAFKLAHALVKQGRQDGLREAMDFDVRMLLDLVALGTIADLVPLRDENRVLVSAGLARLNATPRTGLQSLARAARIRKTIGVFETAFQLAPRLNAAGRMAAPEPALDLLMTTTSEEGFALSQTLDRCNQDRKVTERQILKEVNACVEHRMQSQDDFVIIEGNHPWHIGVVGIVASRVMREYHRPAIILGGDGSCLRGSGRSIVGFDIAVALRECDDLLESHGGHAMAAGVTVLPVKLDAFRDRMNDLASRALSPDQLQPELQLDAEVKLKTVSMENILELERLAPFGMGNPGCQFATRGVRLVGTPQRIGMDKQHYKLQVADEQVQHEAIWWNAGHDAKLPTGQFDLAYSIGLNEFMGKTSVQLRWLDWRPDSSRAG